MKPAFLKYALLCLLVIGSVARSAAQPAQKSHVDIFMGVDLNYRDVFVDDDRIFDFLVNLTPGVKWKFGNHWEAAAAAYIPIINQYGHQYKYIRPYNVTLSRQFRFFNRWALKASAGLFNEDRYGIDIKTMFAVNSWLAISAQVGVTGRMSMRPDLEVTDMKRVTGLIGPEFYLSRWNTQISLRGGQYLYGDRGAMLEIYRHFKHVSVGVFATRSRITENNAGFRIVAMLPPYRRKMRRVNFRPASNFQFSYRTESNAYANRMYLTDPEQNNREGWFDADIMPWGHNLVSPPDFTYPTDSVAADSTAERRGR